MFPTRVASDLLAHLEQINEKEWTTSSSDNDAKMYSGTQGAGSTAHAFSACQGISIDTRTAYSKILQQADASPMDKVLCILATALEQQGDGRNGKSSFRYTFQCGRYCDVGDYIEPHDDFAYEKMDGQTFVRDVAIVLYLSRKWCFENGGLFVDLESRPPLAITPSFNTMITFKVPRMHEVSAIESGCNMKRFSIFGYIARYTR